MENFTKLDNFYRPIPFWSWNEKLSVEETGRQIDEMKKVGIGGYFMHARGGLQTEYMSQEWFANIEEGIRKGKELQMSAWIYDENGWPSGFGNGKVNGRGLAYQQKYLRMEPCGETIVETEHTICCRDGYHFYFEVNPYYVDTLDAKVTAAFLEEIYSPCYERFGNSFEGFFTDEPQVSRNGIPWSFVLEEEYRKAYGEELLEALVCLFLPLGDYKKVRVQFWKLVADLFTGNYLKQIYDWCHERGLSFTGHLTLEESLEGQVYCSGAGMPGYEYFDMPGMDWLGRNTDDGLAQMQLCSVAHQLGKKKILTETFALCGHNVNFRELKGILEWQMIRGVNVFCSHLQGYSIRGIRKRDYPPAMYFQQPWWEEYKIFVEAMSRTGMLLGEGEVLCDTLLIHPQTLVWTLLNGEKSGSRSIENVQKSLMAVTKALDRKHIPFHLGDETLMEKYGSVQEEEPVLVIGKQRYKRVILLDEEALLDNTKKLLREFAEKGGQLLCAGASPERLSELPDNPVTDNENILYAVREYPDCFIHYFVNHTEEEQTAHIMRGTEWIDPITGEAEAFAGVHVFEPLGSLLVREQKRKELQLREFAGEWKLVSRTDNAMLLDFCDYYFDGELQEKNGYVLNIQNRACRLERPTEIRQIYTVEADYVPKRLFLGCETPEIFEITVNGVRLDKKDAGSYVDASIRLMDIHALWKKGVNTIEFTTLFTQPASLYENLKKAAVFESEKNKITYETEIEAVYLVGDFAVKTDGNFQKAERKAVKYEGNFVMTEPSARLKLESMESCGYPFFCGTMEAENRFVLKEVPDRVVLPLKAKGINVIKVRINGEEEQTLLWGKEELDISPWIRQGENTIHLTLKNNLRNLMGPHHLKEGESYSVAPGSFFKEPCIWNERADEGWDSAYCFVETGIEF